MPAITSMKIASTMAVCLIAFLFLSGYLSKADSNNKKTGGIIIRYMRLDAREQVLHPIDGINMLSWAYASWDASAVMNTVSFLSIYKLLFLFNIYFSMSCLDYELHAGG